MRALTKTWILSLGLTVLVPGLAQAQQTYNPDGTPSMISPEGQFLSPDGGTALPAPQPSQAQPIYDPAAQQERFDQDCDPDVMQCADPNEQPYDDGYDPQAYQQFEGALDPYGQWVDDPNYGHVWVPSSDVVGNDFEPYDTAGQWVASNDYGFTWVSDYDWGWAPFHYGRWTCLDAYGWAWIPGTIWGPAWVSWRYGGGYAGWAPMGPRGVYISPPGSLGVRTPWHFALSSELFRRNPSHVPAHIIGSIWNRTSPVNNSRMIGFGTVNARVNLGPSLNVLARDLGHSVPALGLRNSAPSVLPRGHITPHAGIALTQRPYLHGGVPRAASMPAHVTQARAPSLPSRYPAATYPTSPAYRSSQTAAPQAPAYRPVAPMGSTAPSARPVYRAPSAYPMPAYRSTYTPSAPVYRSTPSYSAPAYSAPVSRPSYSAPVYRSTPSYSAPAYSAPVSRPSYSAPVYHSTPSYSAPAYHAAPAPAPASSTTTHSAPAPSFGGGGASHHHR